MHDKYLVLLDSQFCFQFCSTIVRSVGINLKTYILIAKKVVVVILSNYFRKLALKVHNYDIPKFKYLEA